jgi:3-hydroxyisobutyrate dehydrogenase-like beta-hydroxyacid dehydrogenase
MSDIKKVGMLGLGQMGNPMSKLMLATGYEVVGFDPFSEACKASAANGVKIASSPSEVAASCELVFVMVGFDSQVEGLLFGPDGVVEGAKPGLIVALGSTVSPSYAKSLADKLASNGIIMLDIPSARGVPAALAGKLLLLGAGDKETFEKCRPVFSSFASDVFYFGPAGTGQVAKMVNNLILWACTAANDEGLRLGAALGVDPEELRAALHHSSAQNWAMDKRAEDTDMAWAEKDMTIVLAEADQARLSLPLCGSIKEVIKGYKIRLGKGMPTL